MVFWEHSFCALFLSRCCTSRRWAYGSTRRMAVLEYIFFMLLLGVGVRLVPSVFAERSGGGRTIGVNVAEVFM